MRPCRACNAALENNQTTCPECGSDESARPGPAPAPELSQEENDQRIRGTRRLFIAHITVVSWFGIALIGAVCQLDETATLIAIGLVLMIAIGFMLNAL